MSNPNQHETQVMNLRVMIGRHFYDSQHGRPSQHPANVGYSNFRYTNDQSNCSTERHQRKTGQEKTIKMYSTVILRAILNENAKEWLKLG